MSEEKKRKIGNISILVVLFLIIAMSWVKHSVYEATTPYGTLLTGAALGIAFLCYVDLKKAFRDPFFYLMILADMLTLINLFVIHSDKGALLTVVDLLLVMYLASKITINRKQMLTVCVVELFFFFYWTVTPKGYYQGFNINYGGLVLLTGLMFGMILIEKIKQEKKWNYMWIVQCVLMLIGFKIISYYLSRCALIGAAVFTILILIPKKFWVKTAGKVFFYIMSIGVTIGTIPFSVFLVWLGTMREQIDTKILYKSILSGREEVWAELWGVFLKSPITGIGSSYKLHVVDLEGTFEVHSGLLDILFVHGPVVFIIVLCFLLPLLLKLRESMAQSEISKYAGATVFAMLATSFFENYFIVPPFLLLFLLLFTIVSMQNQTNQIDCNIPEKKL